MQVKGTIGEHLTGVFPATIAPYYEGVYIIHTADKTRFAYWNKPQALVYYDRGKRFQVFAIGYWGEPGDNIMLAHTHRLVKCTGYEKICYPWQGLDTDPRGQK